ncbi:hypothetical protein EDD21DRAFT_306934, partial [Dissophora ornata]
FPATDVWPMTIATAESEKLVIGKQSCDALTTSPTRLDCKSSLHVSTSEASVATRIFLNEDSVAAAQNLPGNKDTRAVSDNNLKFHNESTCFMCRAYGTLTQSHVCQSFTIFSFAALDQAIVGTVSW